MNECSEESIPLSEYFIRLDLVSLSLLVSLSPYESGLTTYIPFIFWLNLEESRSALNWSP